MICSSLFQERGRDESYRNESEGRLKATFRHARADGCVDIVGDITSYMMPSAAV